MKKGLLYILVLICCGFVFSGCIKNGTDRTINPSMTGDIGSYNFNATYVEPSTLKPQMSDSTTSLIITGLDQTTGNKIILTIAKFTNTTGNFSVADRKAIAGYVHGGSLDPAASGVITIKEIGANVITGYFTMVTLGGVSVTNGSFVVGKPWVF